MHTLFRIAVEAVCYAFRAQSARYTGYALLGGLLSNAETYPLTR